MTSDIYSTFQDPQRRFIMKSAIPIHSHIHTLMMASYWIVATAALGQSFKREALSLDFVNLLRPDEHYVCCLSNMLKIMLA